MKLIHQKYLFLENLRLLSTPFSGVFWLDEELVVVWVVPLLGAGLGNLVVVLLKVRR